MESAAGDLFVIDAAPERVWCCAVCDVTIKLREGDGLDPEESHAVKLHMAGKPHQKKLRKKAAEEAAAAGILTPGLVQTPEGLVPPPTKRGTKRAADETDTSLFGKQLKCKDASTNAKSVLNELVQQKGWKLSYVHHERYQKVEDVAPGSLLKEGCVAGSRPLSLAAGCWRPRCSRGEAYGSSLSPPQRAAAVGVHGRGERDAAEGAERTTDHRAGRVAYHQEGRGGPRRRSNLLLTIPWRRAHPADSPCAHALVGLGRHRAPPHAQDRRRHDRLWICQSECADADAARPAALAPRTADVSPPVRSMNPGTCDRGAPTDSQAGADKHWLLIGMGAGWRC
jgi:hypothetical protein